MKFTCAADLLCVDDVIPDGFNERFALVPQCVLTELFLLQPFYDNCFGSVNGAHFAGDDRTGCPQAVMMTMLLYLWLLFHNKNKNKKELPILTEGPMSQPSQSH